MNERQARSAMLLGEAAMDRLSGCHVAVFGVGGVGGYCVEALSRGGIGALTLVDADVIAESNMNRQLIATVDTLGRRKVEVMAERVGKVAPDCRVTCHDLFYLPETADAIDLSRFDYVVDAVDTVAAKLELAERCTTLGVPIISAMGAGNKLNPGSFVITDIYRTTTCPLARVMRRELRKRGVPALKVCYSTEEAHAALDADGLPSRTPGSVSFVPGAAGLMIAGEVIRSLIA